MNRTDLTYHKPAEVIDYKSLVQNFMAMNEYLISRNLDYGLLAEVNQLKRLEHELLSLEYKQSQADPQEQQQGVTHYTWITSSDDKVRATHAVRVGQVYS